MIYYLDIESLIVRQGHPSIQGAGQEIQWSLSLDSGLFCSTTTLLTQCWA